MQKLRTIFLILLASLTSCSPHRLTVQTQFLTKENLASYYIGTPDPQLYHPVLGQRLLIQWCFPREMVDKNVELFLKIRFRNHQEKNLNSPIHSKVGNYTRGYFLFDIIGEEYCETGGIATYYVEIQRDGCPIEVWKHPLWVNLITFNKN